MIQPIETTNERRGLPSASGMQRIMDCPASLPLTTRLRRLGQLPEDHGSEDADRGTRIHAYLEALAKGADKFPEIAADERAEAEELWETTQEILTRVFGDVENIDIQVEQRLWLEEDLTGEPVFSGKFDLIAMDDASILVLDYKTGRRDVPDPPANWQLLSAAVLLNQMFGSGRQLYATILQTGHIPDVSRIEPEVIQNAARAILKRLGEADADPFRMGFNPTEDNCKYCPARLACPRLHYDLAEIKSVQNAEILIAHASTPRLDEFLVQLERVEAIAKAARKEMQARLEKGDTAENWHMASGPARRKVVAPQRLASALIGAGADTNAVLEAMSMNVGDAEKVLAKATGLKGKALKERFRELSAGAIEAPEPKPSLKRK